MVQGFQNLKTNRPSNDSSIFGRAPAGTAGSTLYIQDHESVSRELSAPVSLVVFLLNIGMYEVINVVIHRLIDPIARIISGSSAPAPPLVWSASRQIRVPLRTKLEIVKVDFVSS